MGTSLGTEDHGNTPQLLHFCFAGVKNSLVAQDMAFEITRAPWSLEQQIERPQLTKKVLDTEEQAAFRLQEKMPRYIYFAADSKNKWGHQRGYRIQISSSAGEHVPEASSMERAVSWARSGCSDGDGGCSGTPPAPPAGEAAHGWERGWGGTRQALPWAGVTPQEQDCALQTLWGAAFIIEP